ncbi:hypothetical protein BU200_09260, partial [Streptococcus acidominimus]
MKTSTYFSLFLLFFFIHIELILNKNQNLNYNNDMNFTQDHIRELRTALKDKSLTAYHKRLQA